MFNVALTTETPDKAGSGLQFDDLGRIVDLDTGEVSDCTDTDLAGRAERISHVLRKYEREKDDLAALADRVFAKAERIRKKVEWLNEHLADIILTVAKEKLEGTTHNSIVIGLHEVKRR